MRTSTLFWGAILVLAGVVLLLDNLGILSVNVWSILWPLFLIAFGLWILWGTVFRRQPAQEQLTVPLEGARRARVTLSHGAGRLHLATGGASDSLLEGEFGGGVEHRTQRDGDLVSVNLHVPVQVFPFWPGPGYSFEWDLRLNPEIPLSLDVNTGAGESRLDLSGLKVSEFTLQTGASSSNILMPTNAGNTRAVIKSGAASVDVEVPPGVAARIAIDGGLAGISVDQHRFPRQGTYYQSPDYGSSQNQVDLQFHTGVGSVSVR